MRFSKSVVMYCVLIGLTAATSARGDDWPQWGGPKRDGVWRETGIVETLPQKLQRVWSHPVGEGYSGPAVAQGKVVQTDFIERKGNSGKERVLCLDADSGKLLWQHSYAVDYDISYPHGPRATPVIEGKVVYTIGATGRMFCFVLDTGDIVWEKDFQKDYHTKLPIWGMASCPLVDGQQLITLVGGADNATVVSFDKLTGKELWRAINDPQVGYAPPMIYTFGKTRQLIIWHPEAVTSLDPATGKKLWAVPFAIQAGLCVPAPVQEGNRLFVTSFYNGSLMLEVTGSTPADVKTLWKGKSNSEIKTDGLHSIMPTPIVTKTHIYGICSYGQLRCLEGTTGERLWETRAATGEGRWWNAFLTPHQDRVFICNEQGEILIARLSPQGYTELSRSQLIAPTRPVGRRLTIWSHPAFAHKSVFARNDQELVRVNLAADGKVERAGGAK